MGRHFKPLEKFFTYTASAVQQVQKCFSYCHLHRWKIWTASSCSTSLFLMKKPLCLMTLVRILAPSALCRSREGCRSAGGVDVVGRDGGGMELEDPWGPFQPKGSSTIFQGCYITTESATFLPCNTAEKRNPVKPEVIFITNKGCNDPACKAKSGFLIYPTMQEDSRVWVMHWRDMVVNAEMSGSRQSLFLLYILSHNLKTNIQIE